MVTLPEPLPVMPLPVKFRVPCWAVTVAVTLVPLAPSVKPTPEMAWAAVSLIVWPLATLTTGVSLPITSTFTEAVAVLLPPMRLAPPSSTVTVMASAPVPVRVVV